MTRALVILAVALLFASIASAGCLDLFRPASDETEEPTEPPPDDHLRVPPLPPDEPREDDEDDALVPVEALESEIMDILDRAEGVYGIYFRLLDAEGQAELGIRADQPFYAASCYKVALALDLYDRSEAGEIDLNEQMVYQEEHRKSGAGILKHEDPGDAYSLRHLASLSLVHSDNAASHMLLDRLGRTEFENYQLERGAEQVCMQDNVASPRDVSLFLTDALDRSQEKPEPFSEILIWLKEAYPRDRIPAGIPDDVPVASKTGTWPGTYNDAAVVLADDNPFLLIVMSEEVPNYDEGMVTIAQIAEATYQWVDEVLPADQD